MKTTLLALFFLLVAGGWISFRNIRLLMKPDALRAYMQVNPKAQAWIQKHGLEEATALSRRFLPAGIAAGLGMLLCGAWLHWRIYG
jgi:hypothetical protein